MGQKSMNAGGTYAAPETETAGHGTPVGAIGRNDAEYTPLFSEITAAWPGMPLKLQRQFVRETRACLIRIAGPAGGV